MVAAYCDRADCAARHPLRRPGGDRPRGGCRWHLCWAHVDSRAGFSMMRSILYNDVRGSFNVAIQPPRREAVGIGGEQVPILGVIEGLSLRVQNKQLTCPIFSVVGWLIHIVLGRDFCCQMGTVFDDRSVTLQNSRYRSKSPYPPTQSSIHGDQESGESSLNSPKVAAAVAIPPRSETTV